MEDINFWEWLKKRSEINKEQQKELINLLRILKSLLILYQQQMEQMWCKSLEKL
jgi:hypothetical protein